MAKKKIALAAAGILVVAGAAAAVSAPGHRGEWRHGGMGYEDDIASGFGKRGLFHRSVTKDEFDTRTRERFARFDKNGDNVIDPAELEAVLKEHKSHRSEHRGRGRGKMGERRLRAFDTNRDGKVTKEEIRAEFDRRFAEADINSDGKIDDADLPPMMRGRNVISDDSSGMRRGGRHSMKRGLGFLREADANKDGVVTKEEVAMLADSEFARRDWNKDGPIDQGDRDALRQEMTDYAVKRMAHRMGAGPDGKVTREQFQTKAGERFARLDADGDGKLSRDELPGRRHGKHGKHHGSHHGQDRGRSDDGNSRGPGEAGEPPARN